MMMIARRLCMMDGGNNHWGWQPGDQDASSVKGDPRLTSHFKVAGENMSPRDPSTLMLTENKFECSTNQALPRSAKHEPSAVFHLQKRNATKWSCSCMCLSICAAVAHAGCNGGEHLCAPALFRWALSLWGWLI